MATKQTVPISGSIAFDTVVGPPGPKGDRGDCGPAGPPGTDSGSSALIPGLIDVTRFGVLPSPIGNGGDNSANFRKLYASLPGPATLYFPPGQYQWWETVRRDKDYITVQGAGERQTTILLGGSFPAFVDGIPEPTADGFAFTAKGRPDAFGVLDKSIAHGKKVAAGFATEGRSIAYLTHHALALGRFNPADHVWDYHGTLTGLTVRLMIGPGGSGRIPENQALAGLGDYLTHAPGPYLVFTGIDAGPGRGTIGISVRLEGDPPGMQRRAMADYGDPASVHRITLVVDCAGDTRVILVDGKSVPVTHSDLVLPDVIKPPAAGQPLEAQKLDWPFLMGTVGSKVGAWPTVVTPDLIFYGFWVGDRADTVEPADDRARYTDPDCIGFFNPCYQVKDRFLEFDAGTPGGGNPPNGPIPAKPVNGRAVVFDTLTQNIHGGQRTTDLTIEKGSPAILTGPNYGESHERVRYIGGIGGFAHIRTGGGTYTTKIADAEMSGNHLGMSLFGCLARVSGLVVSRGGAYSVSTCDSSVDFDSVMLTRFAPSPDGGFLIRGGSGYGNSIYMRSVMADNEGGWAFKVAFVDMDQAPYTASSLMMESCESGTIGAEAYFIRLKGYGIDANYKIHPLISAVNVRYPICAGAVYLDGPPGVWIGKVVTVSESSGMAGPGMGRVIVLDA